MQPDQVVELIRMEYAELPGLRLTPCQAQRLWGLSRDMCTAALTILTDSQFLVRTSDGVYARRSQPEPRTCGHATKF